MARIRVTMASAPGDSMLMHNERLADPLNPYTRWLGELTGKTKKTEADQEEIARREFLGSGYWAIDEGPNGKIGNPVVPTWNVIRCLQEGGKRQKLGKHVVRALVPTDMYTPLLFHGPQDVKIFKVSKTEDGEPNGMEVDAYGLWKAGVFHNRKGVVIGGRRTMRTRPCFTDWKVEAELELDLTVLDPDKVNEICRDAGKYEGLGDNRPVFGRFIGTAVLIPDAADLIAPDLLTRQRQEAAAASGLARVEEHDLKREENHPNGKERRKRVTSLVGK